MKCEICPVGCQLIVHSVDSREVSGNRCERGREFAIKSLSEEAILITGRIRVLNGNMSHLPVVTSRPVDPSMRSRILAALSELQAEAPIRNGQLIAENVGESGVNLLASRSIRRRDIAGKIEFSKKF